MQHTEKISAVKYSSDFFLIFCSKHRLWVPTIYVWFGAKNVNLYIPQLYCIKVGFKGVSIARTHFPDEREVGQKDISEHSPMKQS